MIKVMIGIGCILCLAIAEPQYVDGVLMKHTNQDIPSVRQFIVIDSFPAGAINYSLGLGCDGEYLWNNEAFSHWFARLDTATGAVVNSFNTSTGNRDITFDGQYLWVSDWQTSSINQFDTSNCTVVNTYYPPFSAGRPNGMAWDSTCLWVGEESGRIYQMTTAGDTVRSIPPPVYYSYDPRGLAFDGTYLWVGYQSSGLIYKVSVVDGSVLETYTAPGAVAGQRFQQGLAFDGQYLWSTVGGSVNMIYRIDINIPGVSEQKISTQQKTRLNVSSNPFVERVELEIVIDHPTHVSLCILNATGSVVSRLENRTVNSGLHTYTWHNLGCQTGVYFVLLETDRTMQSTKLIKIQNK